MQEYVVSNLSNPSSGQLYPIRVNSVKHVNFTSKKYPDGYLQVSCQSIDGHHSAMLKCYRSDKGRFAIWGQRRIYEGYSGVVKLKGVPTKLIQTVKQFCEISD